MHDFRFIKEKFENTLAEKEKAEAFYAAVWSSMVYLSNDEKGQTLGFSEKLAQSFPGQYSRNTFTKGLYYVFVSDYALGIENAGAALKSFSEEYDEGGMMCCTNLLCICYRSLGQLDKAQEHAQMALALAEKIERNDLYAYFQAVVFYQAGELCTQFKRTEKAIELYTKGLDYTNNNPELQGRFLNGLGVLYMNQGDWETAQRYLDECLGVITHKNNILLESKVHSDLGTLYFRQNNFEKALQSYGAALKIREENKLTAPLITSYIQLAEIYFAQGKNEEAIHYAHLALENAEKLNTIIKLFEVHHVLSKIYEQSGNVEKAFEHYKKYTKYKDEVHNQESIRKVEQLNSQHKIESMQQEKEIFRLRNVELKSAMEEITESFRYAKRIQKAILPSDKRVKEFFPESFILYKPKDIVAGDFYWLEEANGNKYIAACDCTGHGVPGAMVSVVCHNALNRAVREFKMETPANILDKARQLIIEEFEKSEEEVKDGMDIVLCAIRNDKLYFSGANNALWIINPEGKFREIKGCKQPVGKYINNANFLNHLVEIKKGDSVYLFSDGYADQFGGPKGKKFRYQQLKDVLMESHLLPMPEQEKILDKKFTEWKGKLEQVDDVCIIGIRI